MRTGSPIVSGRTLALGVAPLRGEAALAGEGDDAAFRDSACNRSRATLMAFTSSAMAALSATACAVRRSAACTLSSIPRTFLHGRWSIWSMRSMGMSCVAAPCRTRNSASWDGQPIGLTHISCRSRSDNSKQTRVTVYFSIHHASALTSLARLASAAASSAAFTLSAVAVTDSSCAPASSSLSCSYDPSNTGCNPM